MKSAPARCAQISSCSSAAARHVSAAATATERPCSASLAESLPIVVVLPVPLTPTTRITAGAGGTAGGGGPAARPGPPPRAEGGVQARGAAGGPGPPHELGRRADADVAGDEPLLEPLPVRVVAG